MQEEREHWQTLLSTGFSTVGALLAFLELPLPEVTTLDASTLFPMKVPRGFAERMVKGDPHDPLLRQVLPVLEEFQDVLGFSTDPLAEIEKKGQPGVLHKYHGRVLLTLTGACAVHCRYCFRRHFPYQSHYPGQAGWLEVIEGIRKDPSIHEVILSGGDPLLVKDTFLAWLLSQLEEIEHVKTVRCHTRIPIVLPERLTHQAVMNFCDRRFHVVFVLHSNHPNELSDAVAQVCQRLKDAKMTLFNQSVLLSGVNDDVDTLVALSHRLWALHIVPYYLHLLDKVAGAAHFDVDSAIATRLHRGMNAKLPGYLVPRLVREIAGAPNKVFISD